MKQVLRDILTGICLMLGLSVTASAVEVESCGTEACIKYFKQYKKYARAGHAGAMTTLGELYINGYGTEKSLHKGLRQYKRAAKYGSVLGQAKTGLLYLTEPEIADIDEGIKYLKKAARNRHGDSAYLLGVIYADQEYGYLDMVESDKWLALAYRVGQKKVREFIEYLHNNKRINNKDYPKIEQILLSLNLNQQAANSTKVEGKLAAQKHKRNTTNINWPEDEEIEVITVSPPTLVELFDSELASLKNAYPDKYAQATGTNIIGRTCDEMISCGSTSNKEFKDMLNALDGILNNPATLPMAFINN